MYSSTTVGAANPRHRINSAVRLSTDSDIIVAQRVPPFFFPVDPSCSDLRDLAAGDAVPFARSPLYDGGLS